MRNVAYETRKVRLQSRSPGEKDILSKAVKVAEFFLNAGGTAFEPALSQALELISNQSFKTADVVFITDGNSPISPKFLSGFLDSKKEQVSD